MGSAFASLIIRSVLVCYGVWGLVLITDLALCESRKPGTCDAQRAEVRGAATTIPATLLAWMADSPVSPHGVAGVVASNVLDRVRGRGRKPSDATPDDES